MPLNIDLRLTTNRDNSSVDVRVLGVTVFISVYVRVRVPYYLNDD